MVKGSGGARRPVAPLPPSPAALRQASGLILHLCLRVAVAASHLDATHLDTFIGAEAQERRKGDPPNAPCPCLRLRSVLGVKPESLQVASLGLEAPGRRGQSPPGRVHVVPLVPAIAFLCPRTEAFKAKWNNSSAQRGC